MALFLTFRLIGAETPASITIGPEPRQDINPALFYWQAYALIPELTEEENQRVSDRHSAKEQDGGDLAARYDQSFKLLRRAVGSKVACDWGVDLSLGPEAMLPQLAKAKRLTQAATFRANVFLDAGKETNAVDDLVAVFVLGRQVATDGLLISALVQFAIENIVTSSIAENYYRFSPLVLADLYARLEAAPSRGRIAACIGTEKAAFVSWYIRKMEEIQARHAGDEKAAMAEATSLLGTTFDQEDGANLVPSLITAAGSTLSGLIQHIRQAGESYDRLTALCALPYEEYRRHVGPFQASVEKQGNVMVQLLVPAVLKSRDKEFWTAARLAMLKAATAYRVNGNPGFESVIDPFGDGPFEFKRVLHSGVDRGFEVKTKLAFRGAPEVLIFIETAGVLLRVDGPKAGTPISRK